MDYYYSNYGQFSRAHLVANVGEDLVLEVEAFAEERFTAGGDCSARIGLVYVCDPDRDRGFDVISLGELAAALYKDEVVNTVHWRDYSIVTLADGTRRKAQGRDAYAARQLAVHMLVSDPKCLSTKCGSRNVSSTFHKEDFIVEILCKACGYAGAF